MKKPVITIFMLIFAFFLIFEPNFVSNSAFAKTKNAKNTEEDLKITAKSALLLDYSTNTVCYEKNSNERLPIASMTKIATLSVVFDALEKGSIKENDMVTISENSASVGGSTAFLDAGASYKVIDLIKTVIIASANDSSVALAEFVAGSENVFVSKMNKLAQSLGLSDTHFENATGLPVRNHYSTAHDIAIIYKTICNNSIYRKFSKIWMEDFIHPSGRKTGLVNTNRMVRTFDGIEGGKTGFTDSARFCLTASASRGTTRFIGVIIGANDSKTRFSEMTNLLGYGFANYENKVVVNKNIPLTISNVKKSNSMIEIFPERDANVFSQKTAENVYTTDYKLNELVAPIKKGDVVGKLFVFDKNNMVVDEVNLISGSDAKKENFKELLEKLIHSW